jgi:hypothetical protein
MLITPGLIAINMNTTATIEAVIMDIVLFSIPLRLKLLFYRFLHYRLILANHHYRCSFCRTTNQFNLLSFINEPLM